jgi:zinc transporter, ZIP family
MAEAFGWGALGASALLVGALVSYLLAPGRRLIAVVMALGTGLLIGSVSFELIDEALETSTVGWVGLLVLVGAAGLHGRRLDPRSARRLGAQGSDGSPGRRITARHRVGLRARRDSRIVRARPDRSPRRGQPAPARRRLIVDLPEGMAASTGLKAAGWPGRRVILMWLAVVIVSAISAAAGYVLLDPESGRTGALAQAFAAGALLAMLADTLLPEAYEVEGVLTGLSSSPGSRSQSLSTGSEP